MNIHSLCLVWIFDIPQSNPFTCPDLIKLSNMEFKSNPVVTKVVCYIVKAHSARNLDSVRFTICLTRMNIDVNYY